MKFVIEGQPVGKGRPRFARRGKFVQTYNPQKTQDYENRMKIAENNIKINSCSGGIYKTYKESWFEHFHLESQKADVLFKRKVDDYDFKLKYESVIILQIVMCGENEVIAELINRDDLNKYFENLAKEVD